MRNRTILAIVVVFVVAAFPPTTTAAPQRALGAPRQGSPGDAVIEWNANAGKAALAACIAPADNPLHESRMYAMTHVAIHDALNAIRPPLSAVRVRRAREARLVARRRRGGRRARRAGARARPAPGTVPAGVHRCRRRERRGRLRGRARRDPGRPAEGPRCGRGQAAAAPCSPSGRRRRGHHAAGLRLPAGRRPRRVDLHARAAVRLRPRLG